MPVILAVVPALLVALFVTAVAFRAGGPLPGDAATRAWAVEHRPPQALTATRVLTGSGIGVWPYLIAVIAGVAAGATPRARIGHAFLSAAVLALGQGVRFALMEAVARPRPPRADWATYASGFSMPSGHSMTAALAAGLLCMAASRHAPRPLFLISAGLATTWAVSVGISRIYLGVHWASDVITGWLLAIAVLSLCTIALRRIRRRRGECTENRLSGRFPRLVRRIVG